MDNYFDIIIIGSGPSGISAALYARRGGVSVAIISMGKGTLEKAEIIDNYYGTPPSITADQLYDNGIAQAKALDIPIIAQEVVSIEMQDNFAVHTNQQKYICRSLIIATGSSRKTIAVKEVTKLEGKGVSYCAICDAFFYRNKTVGVVGNGAFAQHELQALQSITAKQYVFTNGEKPLVDFGKAIIVEEKIQALRGESQLEGVTLVDGNFIPVDGLFIAMGQAGAINFARTIGLLIEDNHIVTDKDMQTNIAGIFSAGDCNGGFLQICKAVYEGSLAGTKALQYVKELLKN